MNVPDGFRKLAAQSGAAPDRVRQRLLVEVRSKRKPFVWWPWAAAALASAVFAGFVFAPPRTGKEQPRVSRFPAPVVQPQLVSVSPRGPEKLVRKPVRRPPVKRAPEPQFTPFIALPGSEMMAPVEDTRIVRVEMERGMLRELGFVGVGAQDRSPVQADFVLGQDGLARAVRFVRY